MYKTCYGLRKAQVQEDQKDDESIVYFKGLIDLYHQAIAPASKHTTARWTRGADAAAHGGMTSRVLEL